MHKTTLFLAFVLLFGWSGAQPGAQAPPGQPPAQPPAQAPQKPPQPSTQKPRSSSQAARGGVTFFITNPQGRAIGQALVTVTGPTTREGETNRDGVVTLQNVRAGSYRARVEADDYITLERDITARSGLEVEMTLNPAPKQAEPPPTSKSSTSPTAPPPAAVVIPPDPNATIQLSSVVEFFSKNQLGRNEPRSEDVVGEAPQATAALLQVRNAFEGRAQATADEVLYVINGKAEINSKGRVYPIETGSLVVIPRGVTYSIANRGRDPLWALSVVGGVK